jgi:DNA-binding transcriptional LysR family regulator
MLDLHRLRVLSEVARQGSMLGAAKALCYTQPAVSHHIARLESETGTPLVVRHGRGVRLTEAGRVLVAHADAALARLAAAEEELAALVGLRAGRVRTAAFPTATAAFLPDALAALGRRAPGVAATLQETEPPEALAALHRGEVDLAVVFDYDGDADTAAGFERIDLFAEEVAIAVPAAHPTGGAAQVRLAHLADAPWVAGCARCREHLLAACSRAGVQPRLAYTTDDHLAVQRLVSRGLAVAALPALAFALHREPGVVRLAAPELGPRRVAVLAAAPPRPPAVAALLSELVTATARWRSPATCP